MNDANGGSGNIPGIAGGMPQPITPPTTPAGVPIPGLAPVSAAQAGGPNARSSPITPNTMGMSVGRGKDKNMAVIASAISGLDKGVRDYKQQKFEQEAAMSSNIMTKFINAQIAKGKIDGGEMPTKDDINDILGGKMDPKSKDKVMKMFEKAMTDPMSGAYIGIQRAQQQAVERNKAQMEQEKVRAEIYDKYGQGARNLGAAQESSTTAKYIGLAAERQARADAITSNAEVKKVEEEHKYTTEQNKLIEKGAEQGRHISFDKGGHEQSRFYTPKEIAADPILSMKKAKIDSEIAKNQKEGNAAIARASAAKIIAERRAKESGGLDQNSVESFAKNIADPHTGITLAQVPIKDRGAVLKTVSDHGWSVAKPLTSRELQNMDLANNGLSNINQAISLIEKHPEIVGPGGWLHNKFELAVNGGDSNATEFLGLMELGNLASLGPHGVRAAQILEGLKRTNSNMYMSQEALLKPLKAIKKSLEQMQPGGGRNIPASGPTTGQGSSGGNSGGGSVSERLKGLGAVEKKR
jgi:hypothetical protein